MSNNRGIEMQFSSLDSAVISIGSAIPVPTPLQPPDIRGGLHFALVGNLWNTNYPFWYPFKAGDENSQYRFQMTVQRTDEGYEDG